MVNNWGDTNSRNLKLYVGSLSDIDRIMTIIKDNAITTIFHCISCMLPDSDMENYISEIDRNFIPTIKIIDCCSRNNIKFIYLSSGGTIYGNRKGLMNENDSLSPISYYGLSKKQLEEIVVFHHNKYNLDFLILRPSNPFGYGQNLYGKQGLISVLIGKILKNEPVTVFGDGTISRDYIYIDDFVFYIGELLNKNVRNTVINIGSGKGHTINEIISILENASGKKINVVHSSSRDNDVKSIILDISKLNKIVQHRQVNIACAISDYYNKIIAE